MRGLYISLHLNSKTLNLELSIKTRRGVSSAMNALLFAVVVFAFLTFECSSAAENNGAGTSVARNRLFSGSRNTIVLSSFNFRFTDNKQRTVKEICARPYIKYSFGHGERTWMKTCFQDSSKNDPFAFTVRYKKVDVERGYTSGSCKTFFFKRFCSKTISGWRKGYTFVLRGFEIENSLYGSPIKEIGILEHRGNVQIFLNDHSQSARVKYRIWYSYVSNHNFKHTNTLASGWDKGHGSAAAVPGVKALQGFWFQLHPGRPLVEFGVNDENPEGSRFNVRVNDGTNNDLFQWKVRYSVWN